MWKMKLTTALALAMALILPPSISQAADGWPLQVKDATKGSDAARVQAQYVPLDRADKRYKICALFPHLKDSIWLAVNYGLVEEAKRLGVGMALYEAGGYDNLPRQLAQFDDCMAGKFDAIVVGAISEGGLAQKLKQAADSGKPVIAVLNQIDKAPVAGRVYPYIPDMTQASAAFLTRQLAGEEGRVVTFPGPAGSGWAELFNNSFKHDVAEQGNIKVIGERFGDSGVSAQLRLIQDALQSYPTLNAVYGGAPAIEAAVGTLAASGRQDVVLVPAYENSAIIMMTKNEDLPGFITQYPVAQGRIAMDMAIRAIEKKLTMTYVNPIPKSISAKDLEDLDTSIGISAPKGFRATYSVESAER